MDDPQSPPQSQQVLRRGLLRDTHGLGVKGQDARELSDVRVLAGSIFANGPSGFSTFAISLGVRLPLNFTNSL